MTEEQPTRYQLLEKLENGTITEEERKVLAEWREREDKKSRKKAEESRERDREEMRRMPVGGSGIDPEFR